MKPDSRFRANPPMFWAYVRSISEAVGYTQRQSGKRASKLIKIPSAPEIKECLTALNLSVEPVLAADGQFTTFGVHLNDYFQHRAHVLNTEVEPALMSAEEAATLFASVRKTLKSTVVIPMNKQKGKKRTPAYLTGLVNMLIDAHRRTHSCDFDPRVLTAFTKNGVPVRTLSRRVDGAFPSVVNPVAIWEIKEYYHTTSFGSRVADGVYETQLDGLELAEMRATEGISAKHYLFLDAHYTWWKCGRSYLCRIFDMVQMGLLDEAIIGREVVKRVPQLVREWQADLKPPPKNLRPKYGVRPTT